jgi:hypothetical protein
MVDIMKQEHLPEKKEREHFQIKSANTICAPSNNYRDFYSKNKTYLHSIHKFLAVNYKRNITVSGQVGVIITLLPADGDNRLILLTTRTQIPGDNNPTP